MRKQGNKMKSLILTSTLLLILSGCGISSGPSLVSQNTQQPSVSPPVVPPFVRVTNGQAADVVLGRSDFAQSNLYDATQINMSGMYGQAVITTPTGGILVCDGSNNRMLGYTTIPTNPFPNLADFVVGQTNWTDNSSGANSKFNGMQGGSIDPQSGKLLLADYGNRRVLIYDNLPSATSPGSPFVASVPVLSIGSTSPIVAGTNLAPNTCDATHIRGPHDVIVINGKVVVADYANNRVLIYNSTPSSDNAPADLVLGQPALIGTCASGVTASRMNGPTSVWTDGTRLAIVDSSNKRVLLWDTWPTADGQSADRVLGQPNMISNTANNTPGFPGTTSEFSLGLPYGVSSNGTQLFVSDVTNNRVLIWNTWPTLDQQAADVVLGQPDFTTSATASPPTASSLYNPYGVKFTANKLIVNDGENGRILLYNAQ